MALTTWPVDEIEKADARTRAEYAKAIKADITFLKDAISTRERMLAIVEGKTGRVPRTRAGNGATAPKPKVASRTRTRGMPSKTLTEPQVFRVLKMGHEQTGAIAKSLSSTPTTVLRWLAKFEKKDFVQRVGTGPQTRWTLTEQGQAYATTHGF